MSIDTTRVHLERLVEIDLNAVKTIKSNNSIYSTITLPNDVKHNMKQMITVARSKLMLYTSLLGIIAKQNIKPEYVLLHILNYFHTKLV